LDASARDQASQPFRGNTSTNICPCLSHTVNTDTLKHAPISRFMDQDKGRKRKADKKSYPPQLYKEKIGNYKLVISFVFVYLS
jgi:hypothetical protein